MNGRVVAWGVGVALLGIPFGANAESYPLVGTGQTACYDQSGRIGCPPPGAALFGQDAQHPGSLPSYLDNGDGTISDQVSGLMWEKGFHRSSWASAQGIAAQVRTGGYEAWRVPTIKELYSLIRFDGQTGRGKLEDNGAPADAKPYLDTQVFEFEYPTQGRYIDAQYISSTAYGGITMGRDRSFFGVNFADGRIKAYPQNGGPGGQKGYYLRLVRGKPGYGMNVFQDNRNGTISDRATGLMWQQDDQVGLSWAAALRACETAQTAGFGDWRLPNAKELQSLVDYTRSPQATQTAALDPIFHISPITDEAGRQNWPFFWSSTTHLDGYPVGASAVYVAFGEALGRPSALGPMGGDRPREPSGDGPGGAGPGRDGFGRGGPPPPHGPRPIGHERGPMGEQGLAVMDVHGAGAQRSSPKSPLPAGSSRFQGPQGDVVRTENAVRCVRGG